jgi:hypothetical protein
MPVALREIPTNAVNTTQSPSVRRNDRFLDTLAVVGLDLKTNNRQQPRGLAGVKFVAVSVSRRKVDA